MSNEEKKGLEIVEEDNFELEKITEEDIEDFYKEHKDAIDLIGGLEIFELLLNTPDEDFNLLKFIVTSELRLKLLLSLYESSKTVKELESYLDGEPLEIKRTSVLKG